MKVGERKQTSIKWNTNLVYNRFSYKLTVFSMIIRTYMHCFIGWFVCYIFTILINFHTISTTFNSKY